MPTIRWLGQAVTDFGSIALAKAALYTWSKSPGVSSPLSNYGTSLEDVNQNWTSRDGIMLHAFSVWWNPDHPSQQLPLGPGSVASAELTAAHLAALQTFGTSQIPAGWFPPPTGVPTVAQGQAQAACALSCEQKYGISSGALNASALATCLSACAQGTPTAPPVVVPPVVPPVTPPPTAPAAAKKSDNTAIYVIGGLAAVGIVAAVAMSKKSLAENPKRKKTKKEKFADRVFLEMLGPVGLTRDRPPRRSKKARR